MNLLLIPTVDFLGACLHLSVEAAFFGRTPAGHGGLEVVKWTQKKSGGRTNSNATSNSSSGGTSVNSSSSFWRPRWESGPMLNPSAFTTSHLTQDRDILTLLSHRSATVNEGFSRLPKDTPFTSKLCLSLTPLDRSHPPYPVFPVGNKGAG